MQHQQSPALQWWEGLIVEEPCADAQTAPPPPPPPPAAPFPERDWELPANWNILWEQDIFLTNGGTRKSIGWLSLYYGVDGTRDNRDDDAPCRFIVAFDDSLVRFQRDVPPGAWIHNITGTPLGEFIVNGWKAQHPEQVAALPQSYREWRERERRLAYESDVADLASDGIDVTGWSEEEVWAAHRKWVVRDDRKYHLAKGWSPERVEEHLKWAWKDRYEEPETDGAR